MNNYKTTTTYGEFTRSSKNEYSHIVVTVLTGNGVKSAIGFLDLTKPEGEKIIEVEYCGRLDLAQKKARAAASKWTPKTAKLNGYMPEVVVEIFEAGRK